MNMKLGCNYWASNAGTEMWLEFDTDVIREDLRVLSENGVEYLRVFPNWRDFQPVEPYYGFSHNLREYRLSGGRFPENRYYLDEVMLERFDTFCDICEEYGMKLIVGLLTGWMSSRDFVPPVLYEKNLFTDPVSLYFEQLFVAGFVERFRDKKAIYAWDHGNECSCMDKIETHMAATAWTAAISNAVYANDRTHPLISGMNGLTLNGAWRIKEQADECDILVTHPYPFWGQHTRNDTANYIRPTLYSAARSKMYADIGKKPCLVEEIGTMGPSVCREDLPRISSV